jgi:hypothetical protein
VDTKNIKGAIRSEPVSAAGNIAKGVSSAAMPFEDFKKLVQEYADLEKIVFPKPEKEDRLLRDPTARALSGKGPRKGMEPEQIDLHQRMLDIYSRVPKQHQELFDKMLNEIKSNG